ncbi:MAG: ParB/RepB/Spo0J family partition protein [Elusimicrobiaceae bacterium]|nr:ParB/RepB/Spo0J family partition protein [Elusimicrobiaceae bacterium]
MRKALGKGLDALLGSSFEMEEELNNIAEGKRNIQKISIDKIIPNRYQPRKNFKEDSLKDLAQSIKQHGLTQPVVVVYDAGLDKYELVVGERRFRASEMAGFKEIDCIVHSKLDDKQLCALALIENIQREDLNPIETAQGYKNLMQKFMVSQVELAEYCGKSKAAVSNSLRLLNLSQEIQNALQDGTISEGHGRALLMVGDEGKRAVLFKRIIGSKMSVRQAENAARVILEGKTIAPKQNKDPNTVAFEQSLQEALKTKVEIKENGKGKGTLTLHFNSYEELNVLGDKLKTLV